MRTLLVAAHALLVVQTSLGIPIPIEEMVGASSQFNDAKLGLTVTCPTGWRVVRTMDQGRSSAEAGTRINIAFSRTEPTAAVVQMQYQSYGPDTPDPKDAEAHYREESKRRAAQRNAAGITDFRPVPERCRLRMVEGRRIVSLYALFTASGKSGMAEYHVHVLGKSGVATFSMTAPAANVEAALADIDQMAETAAVP